MTYSYIGAKHFMQGARNPDRGRPIQNNTRMYERTGYDKRGEFPVYAIRLHSTDVVTIYPGDRYVLNTGGWDTVTTKDRITGNSPARPYSDGGVWYLDLERDPEDPRPEYPHSLVPVPYVIADPGPEPVKSNEGCIAHTFLGVSEWKRSYERATEVVKDDDSLLARPYELDFERTAEYEKKIVDQPTRARNVLRWIEHVEKPYGNYVYVWVWEEKWTWYGDKSSRWSYEHNYDASVDDEVPSERDIPTLPTHQYEQCPHCAAFDRVHAEWSEKYHGSRWGRGHGLGYERMCECLEEFESMDGWRQARKEDWCRVRDGRRVYRDWQDRNRIAFRDGIMVDSNGHPLKREVETIRKREREDARILRRQEIAQERAEREERAFLRFKAKIDKAQKSTIRGRARVLAERLEALNARVPANGSREVTP